MESVEVLPERRDLALYLSGRRATDQRKVLQGFTAAVGQRRKIWRRPQCAARGGRTNGNGGPARVDECEISSHHHFPPKREPKPPNGSSQGASRDCPGNVAIRPATACNGRRPGRGRPRLVRHSQSRRRSFPFAPRRPGWFA